MREAIMGRHASGTCQNSRYGAVARERAGWLQASDHRKQLKETERAVWLQASDHRKQIDAKERADWLQASDHRPGNFLFGNPRATRAPWACLLLRQYGRMQGYSKGKVKVD